MPFDTHHATPKRPSRRGVRAKGLSAEAAIAAHYRDNGAEVMAERFRGGMGEIDLIARQGGFIIFVEVKFGPDHDCAMARVTEDKAFRLQSAAQAYLAQHALNLDTPIRFDIAVVDPLGRTKVIENALWFD